MERDVEQATGRVDALPAVAMVIATHNRPELLRLALSQAIAQDYAGSIDIVVVFDQSTPDETLPSLTAGEWAGPRTLRVVTNRARTPGLAGARNTGILEVTAPYVAFCDDDDEWKPSKIRKQVELLEVDPADVAVTGITVVFGDVETDRVPDPADLTVATLARRRVMEAHPSSVFVRREALLGPIGLVDEEIPGSFGEDYDWMLRAAAVTEIAVVPEALVRVRWGNSLFQRNWQLIIDALDHLTAKHASIRDDRVGFARIQGQRAFALAALGHRKDALRGAWRTFRSSWRERRAYVATVVALRLISAERVLQIAHKRGRGI